MNLKKPLYLLTFLSVFSSAYAGSLSFVVTSIIDNQPLKDVSIQFNNCDASIDGVHASTDVEGISNQVVKVELNSQTFNKDCRLFVKHNIDEQNAIENGEDVTVKHNDLNIQGFNINEIMEISENPVINLQMYYSLIGKSDSKITGLNSRPFEEGETSSNTSKFQIVVNEVTRTGELPIVNEKDGEINLLLTVRDLRTKTVIIESKAVQTTANGTIVLPGNKSIERFLEENKAGGVELTIQPVVTDSNFKYRVAKYNLKRNRINQILSSNNEVHTLNLFTEIYQENGNSPCAIYVNVTDEQPLVASPNQKFVTMVNDISTASKEALGMTGNTKKVGSCVISSIN